MHVYQITWLLNLYSTIQNVLAYWIKHHTIYLTTHFRTISISIFSPAKFVHFQSVKNTFIKQWHNKHSGKLGEQHSYRMQAIRNLKWKDYQYHENNAAWQNEGNVLQSSTTTAACLFWRVLHTGREWSLNISTDLYM